MPIVSSLPCATYAKKDVPETRIGAHVQINEKQIEFMRAAVYEPLSTRTCAYDSATYERTFDHPLHLDFTRLHDALDPAVLPREELDELDLLAQSQISVVQFQYS